MNILKRDLFIEFEKSEFNDSEVSYTTFRRVWKTDFTHLKIPTIIRLGVCDICLEYSLRLEQADIIERPKIQKQRLRHHQDIRLERENHMHHIITAKTYPDMFTLIGIDRMSAIQVPHIPQQPKSWMVLSRPRYEVIAVHDPTNGNDLWHGLNCFDHDSNITLTILYQKLRDLREVGKLAPNLILHFDNCFRENKNIYIYAFCTLLIHIGWVRTIEIFYLPPGHTHAEEDRIFSPLGKGKKVYQCSTPEEFRKYFLPSCYKGRPSSKPRDHLIGFVWNWKDWISPYIRHVQNHSYHRAYQFKKQVIQGEECICMFYKQKPIHENWIGYTTTEGLQLMIGFPEDDPILQPPTIIDDRYLIEIHKTFSKLQVSAQNWWTSFITDQHTTYLDNLPTGNALSISMWDYDYIPSIVPIISPIPSLSTMAPPITIHTHPVATIEVGKGSILAVVPSDDSSEYWIGEVLQVYEDDDNIFRYHLSYYQLRNGEWTKPRTPDIGDCEIGAVLYSGIHFTKQKGILRNVHKLIVKKLKEKNNEIDPSRR